MSPHERPILEACNCPWMECDAHPGGLCSRLEDPPDWCERCAEWHHMCEGIIAPGMHTCAACAGSYRKVLIDDLVQVMTDVEPDVPQQFGALNELLREHYWSRVVAGASSPWSQIQRDARALVAFITFFVRELPEARRQRTAKYLTRYMSFITACMGMDGSEAAWKEHRDVE